VIPDNNQSNKKLMKYEVGEVMLKELEYHSFFTLNRKTLLGTRMKYFDDKHDLKKAHSN
jgi:hypothetical protein